MSRPLPSGDPVQLGPYRLSARLAETSAGVVYLGVDAEGRQASVAVLNRGAAGDAAARDRFRAAIEAAWPRSGRAGEGDGEAAPVVAAQPDGAAPWVATRYDADRPDRVGAERFLDSVVLRGSFGGRWNGRRRGPQFQPYWLGAGEPAVGEAVSSAPVGVVSGARRSDRPLVAAIVTLVAVLVLLGLLLLVLFACQPRVGEPPVAPPDPPSPSLSPPLVPPPTEAPRPSPSATSPSPSPSSPSPGPSDGGEGEDGGPV